MSKVQLYARDGYPYHKATQKEILSAIKVKALEFSCWQMEYGQRFVFADTHEGENPLSVRYIIDAVHKGEPASDSLWFVSSIIDDDANVLSELGEDPCYDEAVTRCQAHHEQHVLSMIEIQTGETT